jgi:nucleotide-binding universal stress UspA family protein
MLKILLPVDATPVALDGVRHVMRLVHHGLRAEVVLAHVEPEANLFEMVTARDPQVLEGVAEGAAQDAFAPAEVLLKAMHITYTLEVGRGDPARVLVEMVERLHCDAVVMGANELGDVHSAVFGSVSHAVWRHAKVPVTLVHHPQAEPG